MNLFTLTKVQLLELGTPEAHAELDRRANKKFQKTDPYARLRSAINDATGLDSSSVEMEVILSTLTDLIDGDVQTSNV